MFLLVSNTSFIVLGFYTQEEKAKKEQANGIAFNGYKSTEIVYLNKPTIEQIIQNGLSDDYSVTIEGKNFKLQEPVSNLIKWISNERDEYYELLMQAADSQFIPIYSPIYQKIMAATEARRNALEKKKAEKQ